MTQQTATDNVEVILTKAENDQAAVLAYQAVHSEVWEELLNEEPERWDGMS